MNTDPAYPEDEPVDEEAQAWFAAGVAAGLSQQALLVLACRLATAAAGADEFGAGESIQIDDILPTPELQQWFHDGITLTQRSQ